MGWKRRPGDGRSSKLERYKANLSWKYEVSSAIADIRASSTNGETEERVRMPLRLLPRSSVQVAAVPPRTPVGFQTLSSDAVRKIFAQEHDILAKSSTLVDGCLHVVAQHLDCYPIDQDTLDVMHVLDTRTLHRLSVLSSYYRTMTPENAAFLCTPSTDALCLGHLNVDAVVDLVVPEHGDHNDNGSGALDTWEDLDAHDELPMVHWSGCPSLRHLELVQCHEISSSFIGAFPGLESLILIGCSDFDAVDYATLLLHLPRSLVSLSLIACTWLTNDMLLGLIRHHMHDNASRLRDVRVWCCCRVALSVEQAWATHLPHARLNVRQMPS
ncbi:Aste57867_592 [Aphanomyces stellatus]|uniref:Aste57867_592 protein n=1 Tax=Aphanomyces stellatus TaxID=120398 RepID=A0A485K882_9STRA|nr:hypothetical protein As57867_000591 [Aphanomyces stellatus]VFT77817.1 Aste57867_592 [Aphanomyces stellatus]